MNTLHPIFFHPSTRSAFSRRELLRRCGMGFGALALSSLIGDTSLFAADSDKLQPLTDLNPRASHYPGPCKAVIMLMQTGGPSNMDLFDYKAELTKRDGQAHHASFETFQQGNTNKLMGSPFPFKTYGQCGMELSELLPQTGALADDLCLVRSLVTDNNNHTEAIIMFASGKILPGRPTLGAWISYGLGTENQNLPGFIVLRDPEGFPTSGRLMYQPGFLSPVFGGTEFNQRGLPVQNLAPPQPIPDAVQRRNLEFIKQLNQNFQCAYPHESELDARIRNYELAARMQIEATTVTDLSKESAATQAMYGLDSPNKAMAGYGRRLLMARRLVEAGVRFVLVFAPTKDANWDHHSDVKGGLQKACASTDQPSAALVKDLRGSGLLDRTLVLWGGEFGRLPVTQGQGGRDHNRHAGAVWLAGGGFKAGHVHGVTDELGYKVVENRVTVPDLHATILHQMGLDHRRLSYLHAGRDETLTDSQVTGAQVVSDLVRS